MRKIKLNRFRKLIYKYRLVIINEDTFEEHLSLRLNRLTVFVIVGISSIVLIIGTIILIAFTPIKEYIPGYTSTSLRRKVTDLSFKVDSLETELETNSRYIQSLRKALTGDFSLDDFKKHTLETLPELDAKREDYYLTKIREDSLLRQEVALEDKYDLSDYPVRVDMVLYPPLQGDVTDVFDLEKKHFGIDIISKEDAPIMAVSDGTVIFVEWTLETGYVIIIEHSFGLISVYKHNKTVFKTQGDHVQYGEIIATMGNTGEYSMGPHLHFEIWNEGYPVNPLDYINFD